MSWAHRSARLVLAFLAACAVGACSAPEEVEGNLNPVVVPMMANGAKVGCELGLHVVRGPAPDDWRRALSVSLLVTPVEGGWGFLMKVAYKPTPSDIQPPETAYLLNGETDNSAEMVGKAESSDRHLLLRFATGPETLKALSVLHRTGVAKVRSLMPDQTEEVWTVDLKDYPQVRKAWWDCLQSYPDAVAAIEAG